MGLGLLKSVDTVEDARNSLLSLVKKLKGFYLLLDENGDTSVRMHDLVHDVANDIASRDGRLLSVACGGDELKNWTDEALFVKCSKISINSNSLPKLSLERQKLEMFYLRCEDNDPLQVPNGVFANMEKLKVLSLRNLKNLASLGFLKNLQTLCLDQCEVEDIAVVGELSKLEILSLRTTNMKQLPKEIGELTSLRLLDLTHCYSLQVIVPNVLSRLTRLEDLRMRYCSIRWEAEHEGERSNASLSELKHLSLLTALEINISNPGMLPKDLFSDKLERFHICIGHHFWEGWSMNTLQLQFTTGDELDQGLKMLVKGSEYLTLQGGANVNETAYRLEGDNFRQLKHLQLRKLGTTYTINSEVVFSSSLTTLEVTDCDGIKFLFSSSTARSLVQLRTLTICRCRSMVEIVSTQKDEEKNNIPTMFSKLESLTLTKLPSLVGFCSGSYAGFSSLEEALISNGQSKSTTITKEIEDGDSKNHLGVDNAVHYFLFDEKVTFPRLEILWLTELPKLEATEERLETMPKFVFPKVTKLQLFNLPQFKSIYPGTHVLQWPSLQKLLVDKCGEVRIIAGELSVYQEKQESASHSNPIEQPLILIEKGSSLFPSMETLTLGAIEMWSGPPPAQVFSKVKLVVVGGATFSKHATFLQRLHNLEKNIVTGMRDKDPCREVFVDEGNSGGEIHPVGIFPQVRILKLQSLNGIMHIGTESSQSAVPVFPKLERLQVWDCSELKNLDSSTISFQNLTALTVDSLAGLKYLVSHRIARSLMQLTRLKIRYCKIMEVIVATEEDDELAFSRLKHLELRRVPHLQGLCSGNCILKFPSLETLSISRRLKSKLFSHDEIRCKIDYNTYDTDVEDAPADDDDGGDDNEVNNDGHGNDKKDDEDSACDANVC